MSEEHPYHVADALHVHGQETSHDPVFIVGPRVQLELLRAAIDKALGGEPQSVEVFTADGEGYRVIVIPVEDTRDAVLPYSDRPGGVVWEGRAPHEMLGRERYRALMRGAPTVEEKAR